MWLQWLRNQILQLRGTEPRSSKNHFSHRLSKNSHPNYFIMHIIHCLAAIVSPHPREGNLISGMDVIFFEFQTPSIYNSINSFETKSVSCEQYHHAHKLSSRLLKERNATFGRNVYFGQTNRATPIQAKVEKPSAVN
jgi:hypothetical protein